MRLIARLNEVKYAGILMMTLLIWISVPAARADTVVGSFSKPGSFGGNGAFFTGTFLFQDSIGACNPELCDDLLPILNANVAPSAAAPVMFVIDAANSPDWTTITSLLGNNQTFLELCVGFTNCNSLFADTIGHLFFPNGGSFAGDKISSLSVTLNPVTFDITPAFDTVFYTETISVLAVPEPSSVTLIFFGGVLLLCCVTKRSWHHSRQTRLG